MVDRELSRLRDARPHLRQSVPLIVVGSAAAIVGGLASVALWASARERGYRWDEHGNRAAYTHVPRADRAAIGATALISALGLAAVAVGVVRLVPLLPARRETARQIAPLRERRRTLLEQLQYSLTLDTQHVNVSARLSL